MRIFIGSDFNTLLLICLCYCSGTLKNNLVYVCFANIVSTGTGSQILYLGASSVGKPSIQRHFINLECILITHKVPVMLAG